MKKISVHSSRYSCSWHIVASVYFILLFRLFHLFNLSYSILLSLCNSLCYPVISSCYFFVFYCVIPAHFILLFLLISLCYPCVFHLVIPAYFILLFLLISLCYPCVFQFVILAYFTLLSRYFILLQ